MKSAALLAATLLSALAPLSLCGAAPQQKAPAKNPPPALTLAQNGKTEYVIALAADAIPAEQTAARELSEHLLKISGATFSIKPESEVAPDAAQILVGAGARVKKLLPAQNWKELGSDGIVIKTVGKNLILAGGRPRGALYAIYSFLENTCGVRWWTPTESTIPAQSTLSVPPQTISYAPQIRTREPFYTSVQRDPIFATRLKANGHHQTQDADWGGHNSILGFVHTFDKLLPPEKYFAAHPEWYSDPNNGGLPCTAQSKMPEPQHSQLCLTNEAARLELTKNALEWIRQNPEAGMISISQNDNRNKCNAPADLEIEKREGSPSGPLLHFVNAVAADIEKEFPDFLVETLAYQHTRQAPKIVRPRDNVVIRLCSIEADFSRPLQSDANADFRDDVLAWQKIAPRLYIWDYVTNFGNVIFPHPNWRVLGPNVRFFAANNAIGLFEQGDAYSNGTGDFVALRVWVLSHLMWNPALDQKQLEGEFLRGYYGKAAPHLRAYLDTIPDAFAQSGLKLSTFQSDSSWLTLDAMNAATKHYRAAEAAVADDPILSQRVRRERLALDNAWLVRYKSLRRDAQSRKAAFEGPDDPAAYAAEFVRVAKEFKAERNSEGATFEPYAAQMLTRFAPAAPLPEFARGKAGADVIEAQEGDFRLYRSGTISNLVDDDKASNGRAAKVLGSSKEWAVQFPLAESEELLKNGPWHCYVMARVQAKPGAAPGAVLSSGLYDVKNKVSPPSVSKTLAEMREGEYHIIDLGLHQLPPDMYFWVAPPAREDIEAIFIDRFVLVREPNAKLDAAN